MGKEDQDFLATSDPSAIRKEFGDFFARQADYGGMFKSQYSRETSANEDANTVEAEVSASQFSTGISVHAGVQTKQDNYDMTTYFEMSCFGGDPTALVSNGSCDANCVSEVQSNWANTVSDDNLVETGAVLYGIWQLLDGHPKHLDQQTKLKDYLLNAWATENQSIPPESGYATRDCDLNGRWKTWCDDFAVGSRRRRNQPGWYETLHQCPDGCREGGQSTDALWCNDNGGFWACGGVAEAHDAANVSGEVFL